VEISSNRFAGEDAILADDPDVAIVATGGLPRTEIPKTGNEFVTSTWGIISGDVKAGSGILIYDDAGDHAGLQAAKVVAASEAKAEMITRDRAFAPEVIAMDLVPYMRFLQKRDVRFTVT
jgi:N-methyl-L-proline demethylase